MKTGRTTSRLLTAGATLLAAAATQAQESQPAPTPASAPGSQGAIARLNQWFNKNLPDVITEGKVNLNARLRYEYANQEGLEVSHAPTIRTRLGYTTGELYGFRGMLEFENVTAIGSDDNYNQAGLNPGAAGKTVVADPEATELNQGWVSYHNWSTTFKAGRQRIKLDNDRFIGNVGWRQNEQTYDAVSLANECVKGLQLFYAWIGRVNRVLGPDHPQGRWNADAHVIHLQYEAARWATVGGYVYLLDLESSPINAADTYGGFVTGTYPVGESGLKLSYRGEFAYQQEAPRNPVAYDALYYHVAGNAGYDIFSAGVGYEVLGSDNGRKGFSTPLATLHAHNGWADVFLNTPNDGLRDLYAWVGVQLPGEIPIRFVYHHFEADDGSNNYGNEYDAVASKKFGKHWTLLAKLAVYDEQDVFAGTVKGWVQGEFNY